MDRGAPMRTIRRSGAAILLLAAVAVAEEVAAAAAAASAEAAAAARSGNLAAASAIRMHPAATIQTRTADSAEGSGTKSSRVEEAARIDFPAVEAARLRKDLVEEAAADSQPPLIQTLRSLPHDARAAAVLVDLPVTARRAVLSD
jgi:hypothetical protein